jgi:lysozyme
MDVRELLTKNGNFLKGNVMPNATISEKEAEQLLAKDLEVFENIVTRKVRTPLSQNQFDALVSHTYNTGGSDTLFKLINQNAPADQIRKWFTTNYQAKERKTISRFSKTRC